MPSLTALNISVAYKHPMHTTTSVLVLSLTTLQHMACAAGLVYQWSDAEGRVHYSDTPPLVIDAETVTLERDPRAGGKPQGLRPGERALLDKAEFRQQQQKSRSRATGLRAEEQRAELQRQCRSHRKRLKLAQGPDDFKQHARFLRNNCW